MRLALLALALLSALPARARQGQVLGVTGRRAYLDAGARDGLAPGVVLQLAPGRACVVERVSDRYASCTGPARAGDRFDLIKDAGPPRAPATPPPPLPPAEQDQRKAALGAARPALVEFNAPIVAAGLRPLRGGVALSHSTWAAQGMTPYQQERADASLHAPLGGPARIDLDLSALRWSRRPATRVFRPDADWQLYVREASLSASGASFGATAGRLRPAGPSALLIDGAQLAYKGAASQLSLYAGALPDASTIEPGTSRLTGGAAWSITHAADESVLRWARHEGRATVLSLPEGQRYELEGAGLLSLGGAVDVSGDLRLAAGALAPAAGIDALRLELNARLGQSARLWGGIRHEAQPFPADAGAAAGPARHADLGGSIELADGLLVSASGGFAGEAGSGLYRAFGGPEVALTRLFGGAAVVSAGYQEERGWLNGRSAWAQCSAAPAGPVRALVRVAWSRDERSDAQSGADQELAVTAGAAARLLEWLEVSGSLMGRAALTGDGKGLAGTVRASGSF